MESLNGNPLLPDTEPRQGAQVGGGILTVRSWGERWLKRREQEGVRSVDDDRSRWRTHILSTAWADRPLSRVTRTEAREWLSELSAKRSSNPAHRKRERVISALTMRNALNLIRAVFQSAVDEDLCPSNPFTGLRVRRSRHARTRDPWTVLYPPERSILGLLPKPERLIARVALGSAMRQGEQWALHLADVRIDGPSPSILVRYGRPNHRKSPNVYDPQPTKNGKPRELPLFGLALRAMREWLLLLPTYAPNNPHGLVFPKPSGAHRSKGRLCRAWARIGKVLGRPFRWHDLRHSCASALVGGWVGKPRRLEAVRVFLGHSSITQTERYAHFASDALTRMWEPEEPERESMNIVDVRSPKSDASSTSSEPSSSTSEPFTPGSIRPMTARVVVEPAGGDGGGSGGDDPPDADLAVVVRNADALGRILRTLQAFPRTERVRMLAVLRAFFPGEWPADRAIGGEGES